MTKLAHAINLIAFFPAAGAGGTTLEQLEKLAVRRGRAFVVMPNPESIEALKSGQWQAESIDEIQRAVEHASASSVILIGHCLGGLAAICLSSGVGLRLAVPLRVLAINTPCPDSSGRTPTMSQLSNAEIAAVLSHDGFPQDLLDDDDMLAEIVDGLRQEAKVADKLAEWISLADDLVTLHVLSTRGDMFSPPEECAAWRHRVSDEFALTITNGGHSIDETSIRVLERMIDSVIASVQADPA